MIPGVMTGIEAPNFATQIMRAARDAIVRTAFDVEIDNDLLLFLFHHVEIKTRLEPFSLRNPAADAGVIELRLEHQGAGPSARTPMISLHTDFDQIRSWVGVAWRQFVDELIAEGCVYGGRPFGAGLIAYGVGRVPLWWAGGDDVGVEAAGIETFFHDAPHHHVHRSGDPFLRLVPADVIARRIGELKHGSTWAPVSHH